MSLTSRLSLTNLLVLFLAILGGGCSLRSLAVNKLGDALAAGGDVFATDDDPELVGDALPFSLKLIESLLAESPRHGPLLLAASRGFTQYSYGWVQPRATEIEAEDPAAAALQNERARRLYLRARTYGLRGIEVGHPRFEQRLRNDSAEAMKSMTRRDVPVLYWTAASWGLAISLSKDQPEMVADLPLMEAMIDRALELEESYDDGAIHSFLISYEVNRAGGIGDPFDRARRHFDRSVELSGGKLASPFVAFAEAVSVATQNRSEFEAMLQRALGVDADATPKWRVENRLSQRRAQWLLDHVDELFISDPEEKTPEEETSEGEPNE